MTVPVLDALTSTIGEELTLLAGFRLTRLRAPFIGEQPVATGVLNASSVTGLTITLSSGTFGSAANGHRFRITSGPRNGRSAIISSVVSPTQIQLGSSVESFTTESWEVVVDPMTTMPVESTNGFDNSGTVICDGIEYTYSSKTLTTLIGLTQQNRTRARGFIRCPAGSAIADGVQLTIDDQFGVALRYEFDKDGVVSSGSIGVSINNSMTATQVRNALYNMLIASEAIKLEYFAIGPTDIEIWHQEEGAEGNGAMTLAGVAPGLVVDGLRGGQSTSAGAARDHEPLAHVFEYTRNYSSLDKFRRGFFLETAAEPRDLEDIGNNLGVPRPAELSDEADYRNLIAAVAYKPRGTEYTFKNVLDAVLGAGQWDYFEDLTGSFSGNNFPTAAGTNRPNTIFIRRRNNDTTSYLGRAFLDQTDFVEPASTTSIPTPGSVVLPYSLTLAEDLSSREVASGIGAYASAADILTNTVRSTAAFPADIAPGDVFEITSGPYNGQRATIQANPSTSEITLGTTEGQPHLTLSLASLLPASWRVVRPASNFRYELPQNDVARTFPGAGSTVAAWAFRSAGTVSAGDATVVSGGSTVGRYTRLVAGPASGDNISYYHTARIRPESTVSFEIVSRLDGTLSNNSSRLRQWFFAVRDGARALVVGCRHHGTHIDVGILDNAYTSFFAGTSTIEVPHNGSQNFFTARVEKDGTRGISLYINNQYVTRLTGAQYATLNATAAQELEFGSVCESTDAPEMHIKAAHWNISTSIEYLNARFTGGVLASPGNTLTHASAPFLSGAGDVGRRVRISDFGVRTGSGGTPNGEWEILSAASTSQVTLRGPLRENLGSYGSYFPNRLYVEGDAQAFLWPDNLGHNIQILAGPNAGTYQIARILDPVTLTDYAANTRFPNFSGTIALAGTAQVPYRQYSHIVELATNLPAPADDTLVNWRLQPIFVADSAVTFEIVNASTFAASTITLRQALPDTAPLFLRYTTVPSATLLLPEFTNEYVAPNYDAFPFYLWDNWSWLRDYLETIRPAGIKIDFDNLFEDTSGLHVR